MSKTKIKKRQTLKLSPREQAGSRSMRRLRQEGQVPGVLYGSDQEAISFQVSARELRNFLQSSTTIFDVQLDDGEKVPSIVKDIQRHPVREDMLHIDLMRVRADRPVSMQIALELTGVDECVGIQAGGILEHRVRELNVQALPNEIPELLTCSIATLEIGGSATVATVEAPEGVTLLDNEETVIASILAPRLVSEEEAEGEEGAGEEAAEGAAEGESAAESGDEEGEKSDDDASD